MRVLATRWPGSLPGARRRCGEQMLVPSPKGLLPRRPHDSVCGEPSAWRLWTFKTARLADVKRHPTPSAGVGGREANCRFPRAWPRIAVE